MARTKQIAILDENFVLSRVVDSSNEDWLTSVERMTVALPPNNDMDKRIGSYYYDFNSQQFIPLRIMGVTGQGAIDFGSAVVEVLNGIADHIGYKIPSELVKILQTKPGVDK